MVAQLFKLFVVCEIEKFKAAPMLSHNPASEQSEKYHVET